MCVLCFQVFQELQDVFHNAQSDDSRVLLLTGSGNVFCSGIDLHYLLTECSDRRLAAKTMSDCLRSVALIPQIEPVSIQQYSTSYLDSCTDAVCVSDR